MSTLTRYLSREFVQNFFLCLGTFATIYLIVEFFERINAFLHNQAPLTQMASYFLNKIPGSSLRWPQPRFFCRRSLPWAPCPGTTRSWP